MIQLLPFGILPIENHPLMQNLIGWWPLNEGHGQRIYNIASTRQIVNFGNGSNLLWSTDAMGRPACVFNSASSSQINIGNNSIYNFTTQSFSISFNINILGINYWIIGRGGDNTNGWRITIPATDNYIQIQTSAPTNQTTRTANNTILLGNWYHILATRSGSSCRIYINGVDAVSSAASHDDPITTTNNLFIGRSQGGFNLLKGRLSDIRIWNRALSPVDAMMLYQKPFDMFPHLAEA